MAIAFELIALLALAAAGASWVVAVGCARRVLAARRIRGEAVGAGAQVLALVWPFALRPEPDDVEAVPLAVRSSKATVAFFVAVMLAVAAISASTNLIHKRVSAGAIGPAAGALPSKS